MKKFILSLLLVVGFASVSSAQFLNTPPASPDNSVVVVNQTLVILQNPGPGAPSLEDLSPNQIATWPPISQASTQPIVISGFCQMSPDLTNQIWSGRVVFYQNNVEWVSKPIYFNSLGNKLIGGGGHVYPPAPAIITYVDPLCSTQPLGLIFNSPSGSVVSWSTLDVSSPIVPGVVRNGVFSIAIPGPASVTLRVDVQVFDFYGRRLGHSMISGSGTNSGTFISPIDSTVLGAGPFLIYSGAAITLTSN
jgi:hypothetical protein